jgi:hypothetical protein
MVRKRWFASLEVPLHQRNTIAELQLLLVEFQLDFENPDEIRSQDLHEPFIVPVTIDAKSRPSTYSSRRRPALKIVAAWDTLGVCVHCDTTCSIFNND